MDSCCLGEAIRYGLVDCQKGGYLVEKVTLNDIAQIVACHDIPMHLGSTPWSVELMDVDLSNNFMAHRRALGCVILVDEAAGLGTFLTSYQNL